MTGDDSFSRRFGYRAKEPPVSVRDDAPEALRYGVAILADNLGLDPHNARLEACGVLLTRPDPGNWSAYPNVFDEVQHLLASAPWYRVYDIAESFHDRLAGADWSKGRAFQDRLNELCREHGIGWEMRDGRFVARGSEAFAQSLSAASEVMRASGRTTAAGEMHEALMDISRRPAADVTGAIQHAMAALECVVT